jgi:hypothetical protein
LELELLQVPGVRRRSGPEPADKGYGNEPVARVEELISRRALAHGFELIRESDPDGLSCQTLQGTEFAGDSGMGLCRDKTDVSWSDDGPTDPSLSSRIAYNRARAAYDRLQDITTRSRDVTSTVQLGLSSDEWSRVVAELVSLRRAWNDAFSEFYDAVRSYNDALADDDYRPPRKPR